MSVFMNDEEVDILFEVDWIGDPLMLQASDAPLPNHTRVGCIVGGKYDGLPVYAPNTEGA